MGASGSYIHGFSEHEQDRLWRQALSLEPYVFGKLDYAKATRVLEVGCGVGAQMRLICRHWPHLTVTGVDREVSQIAGARAFMAGELAAGRVRFAVANGRELPFPDEHFDGAFLCWMLEHVDDPLAILRELRRVLKPGSVLYDTEVFNSGLYSDPPSPAMETYWKAFNDQQRNLGGDPDVGIKLNNIAREAGFSETQLYDVSAQLDRGTPEPMERKAFLDYWHELLLTGAARLIECGSVARSVVDEMGREFTALRDNLDSVFLYRLYQLRAVNP